MLSGNILIANTLIYQQNGRIYSLTFDCANSPIKISLDTCKSIPFALSMIKVLNARDKTYKLMMKKGKFLPPIPTDGNSKYAEIYLKKSKQEASFRLDMPDDLYKEWQKFYWFDKEVELFKFISTDTKNSK